MKSAPLRFTDPLGLVTVECEDCWALGKATRNVRERIYLLQSTGSAINTTPGASNIPVGTTLRESFSFPGASGSVTDTATFRTGNLNFQDNPRVFLCVGVHERVHREMCRRFGASLFNSLPESVVEFSAYEEELKCLRSARQNGSLELGLGRVEY